MQKDVSPSETIKWDSFLPRIWRQGRNYSTLVGWLLYRAFRGRTRTLAIATVLSLLHLCSQAAAIYVVYWYGKQMESTGLVTVPFLNVDVNLKDQPEWLWAIVVVSTGCFVISAVLLYLSRRQLIDVVEKHFARSLEQLVLLTLHVPDPRAPIATHLFLDHGLGGLSTGCRRGTFTAVTFANAITAVIGGLGAAFFLFRIDLSLTLLIVISGLLAALFLYPLTLRGAKSAKDQEKAQAALRTEVRRLNEDPTVEQTATSLESADEVARTFMMRRRVLTELVFATEIGITILLGVVIYYMASQALAGREQWAIFIAYIGALRMTLYGGAQAVRAFASVSRYYPQIVRYYLFIKDMQKVGSRSLAELRRGEKVILGTLPNGEEVVAEVGDCLAMLAAGQISEPMFALVGAKAAHSGQPVAAAIVNPANVREGAAGLVLISFPKLDKDGAQIRALLKDALKDKVRFIVYHHTEKMGSFGEKHVLTVQDGELQRFALLGTEEGDAVLKEFSLKAALKREPKRGLADDEEEEDM
jgi:ABC-type multidrug transport system fused ATPase/permease subunit